MLICSLAFFKIIYSYIYIYIYFFFLRFLLTQTSEQCRGRRLVVVGSRLFVHSIGLQNITTRNNIRIEAFLVTSVHMCQLLITSIRS